MGNLIRLLLILLAVWVVVALVRQALSRRRAPSGEVTGPAKMLPCARCGVHVPEAQAVRAGERVYCCEEHRRAADGED